MHVDVRSHLVFYFSQFFVMLTMLPKLMCYGAFFFVDFEKRQEEIVNLDDVTLSKHVITATGKAKLLITIANDVIFANPNPLYRNRVLAHVKQLQEVGFVSVL